jgi:hypothetical protein
MDATHALGSEPNAKVEAFKKVFEKALPLVKSYATIKGIDLGLPELARSVSYVREGMLMPVPDAKEFPKLLAAMDPGALRLVGRCLAGGFSQVPAAPMTPEQCASLLLYCIKMLEGGVS